MRHDLLSASAHFECNKRAGGMVDARVCRVLGIRFNVVIYVECLCVSKYPWVVFLWLLLPSSRSSRTQFEHVFVQINAHDHNNIIMHSCVHVVYGSWSCEFDCVCVCLVRIVKCLIEVCSRRGF